MAKAVTRLSGHGLAKEGAPYKQTVDRWVLVFGSWTGAGLCSCGDTSDVLESNRARKNWHRQHKDQIREENRHD